MWVGMWDALNAVFRHRNQLTTLRNIRCIERGGRLSAFLVVRARAMRRAWTGVDRRAPAWGMITRPRQKKGRLLQVWAGNACVGCSINGLRIFDLMGPKKTDSRSIFSKKLFTWDFLF